MVTNIPIISNEPNRPKTVDDKSLLILHHSKPQTQGSNYLMRPIVLHKQNSQTDSMHHLLAQYILNGFPQYGWSCYGNQSLMSSASSYDPINLSIIFRCPTIHTPNTQCQMISIHQVFPCKKMIQQHFFVPNTK